MAEVLTNEESLEAVQLDEGVAADSVWQASTDQALLQAIHPVDAQQVRAKLLQDYIEVREDFFEHELFREWRSGRSWTLCCHGGPRSGKVMERGNSEGHADRIDLFCSCDS